MATLADRLPAPKYHVEDEEEDTQPISSRALVSTSVQIPPYGSRSSFVPRKPEDFGDGGAFPEVHFSQYPLRMGLKGGAKSSKSKSGAVVPMQVDKDGNIKYDALLRQGQRADKIIHSTYDALAASNVTNDHDRRQLPNDEAIAEATRKTQEALGGVISSKIAQVRTTHVEKQNREATYVRYNPAQPDATTGVQERIIRMVERQVDPLEPPKFKTNKKIPRGPPSPPAPVLHSPPRKVTAQEAKDWKIPPCISNWKNAKGFVVPLDKRMAADGRALQDVTINDNFAKLSEALYIAERSSREAISMRQEIQKRAAQKEKERKEEVLRKLAQRARDERVGIRHEIEEEVMDEFEEREQLRRERARERTRERNIANAAPAKKTQLQRNKDRDISERIALGLPAPNTQAGEYDTRLFGQSQGLSSGFGAEDEYDVYDRPFRGAQAQSIYKPTKSRETTGDEEYEQIRGTDRFRPDKGFSGTEGGSGRIEGPVQFEKSATDELSDLTSFLKEAKRSSDRDADTASKRSK